MTNTTTLRAIAAVLLLAMAPVAAIPSASTPAAASPGTSTPASMAAPSCENSVVHDAFRVDEDTISAAANGTATSTASNTRVRVEQATGFIRLNATNPNGYCVKFQVELASDVITPAELGYVDSLDGNTTAVWHAVHDFNASATYTSVTFTLPAASTATFAPSEARVTSLAWTGDVKAAGGSLWNRIADIDIPYVGDDGELDQRTYTYSPTNNSTTIITVPLENESDGRRISDWQAMYRTPDQGWTPLKENSNDAVFYRKVDETTLQFVFNDRQAEVRFTANPTLRDQLDYDLKSYLSGVSTVEDWLHIGVIQPPATLPQVIP